MVEIRYLSLNKLTKKLTHTTMIVSLWLHHLKFVLPWELHSVYWLWYLWLITVILANFLHLLARIHSEEICYFHSKGHLSPHYRELYSFSYSFHSRNFLVKDTFKEILLLVFWKVTYTHFHIYIKGITLLFHEIKVEKAPVYQGSYW